MKRSRIVCIALALLFLASSLAFGEYRWESVYDPADLLVSGSIGAAFPFALVLYPGAELILTGVKIGETVPLDFGVAARAQLGWYPVIGTNTGWTTFGVGAFGTAHISFNELEDHALPFLENFDFYISLGIGVNYFIHTFLDPEIRLGFASFEGMNWFFRENMALKIEYAYWGYVGNQMTVGIMLRL